MNYPVVAKIYKGYKFELVQSKTVFTVLGSQTLRGEQYYICRRDYDTSLVSVSRQEVLDAQKDGSLKVFY